MSTTRTPRCRLAAIAAAVCWFAGMMCCTSPAVAQYLEALEWATDESGALPDESGSSSNATDDAATGAVTPDRTPIQRNEPSSTGQTSFSNVGRRSWVWAWVPIALVVVLWWLVNHIRHGKSRDQGLPEGVIVPLGRRSVGGGYVVQLIRIGSRILVVTPTAEGLKTLSEIADPQEVERLVAWCLQSHQGAAGIGGLFSGRPIRTEVPSERPPLAPTADAHNRQPVRATATVQQARAGHGARALREVSR